MTTLIDASFLTPLDCAPTMSLDLVGRDAALTQHVVPAAAKKAIDNSLALENKWAQILADGAPVFVPVKRYSIAELFRLRRHASNAVEVDVHHIENSIVSARQRAAFQSPIPLVAETENTLPVVEPLFVPLYVPCQAAKACDNSNAAGDNAKDSDSARSASPTVAQVSSDEDEEKEQPAKVKKVHRSRRGGKRHPNKNKVASAAADAEADDETVSREGDIEAETAEWQTVGDSARPNKNRASKAELAAKSGEAFSSAVMRRRRLQAKERK